MIRIALLGQPNCGKSTLFNSVAGYRTVTSNFPGTTVEYVTSRVAINGESIELVDLPGIYSLASPEEEELLARDYLLRNAPDAIINILDSSVLSRSLELTIELLDLKIPMVVSLNMIDEAKRKGIEVDVEHLARDLGAPVIRTISTQGYGVSELFQAAVESARKRKTGNSFSLSRDVEDVVSQLCSLLEETSQELRMPSRLFALKLLEEDREFESALVKVKPHLMAETQRLRQELSSCHGRPSDMVVSSERHSLAMNLFEHVAKVKPRTGRSLRDRVDGFIMAPYLGYLFLGLILISFFSFVFVLGRYLEEPLLGWFEGLSAYLAGVLDKGSLLFTVSNGFVQGFSGGIGIVLPYLVPFLLGLALLEDVGYLPRAAFLMDSIMHRIGLHGKSVIPFVLGYGCNVPSLMSVKTLDRVRDRFITAILVTFVPCAARTTIIFALVAFYLGPVCAFLLYLLNAVVIAGAGRLLSQMMPEISPGMILEIPRYRLPSPRTIINKMWFRLREFVVIAWPLLIVGSVVLSLLEYLHLSDTVNRILSPFTGTVLGLPAATGVTLIFGILRKELTIIMLVQALGTSNFSEVLGPEQMLVFTIFTLFYVPCLATLGMLRSVIGTRGMLFTLFFDTAIGTLLALSIRLLFRLF